MKLDNAEKKFMVLQAEIQINRYQKPTKYSNTDEDKKTYQGTRYQIPNNLQKNCSKQLLEYRKPDELYLLRHYTGC